VVSPQKPLAEQQFPNDAPVHTLPLAPHPPSVVMLLGGHVPKSGWQPVPQSLGASLHLPPAEQHVPKEAPVQLYSAVPPHEPSGDGIPVHGGALQLPYRGWLPNEGQFQFEHRGYCVRATSSTYHPVPQKASLRPQTPPEPQQAPHVSVHTQLFGVLGPQVPSWVMEPVSQAGGSPVVWATTATPDNRSPTKADRRDSIMSGI
jgi:hypothetical protein